MAFTLATIILYSGKLTDVASISVFSILLVFALVNLSVISLRFKHPSLQRPFMLPFKVMQVPILPVLGLIMTVVIMFQFNYHVVLSTVVPLISIMILCLILTKRKIDQKQKQKSLKS
jgi:APA family basic amino acid/polyamine antiporter